MGPTTAGQPSDDHYKLTSALVWEAFDQAPAFTAVLRGPDHVFEYVNQAYLQLVGFRDPVGLPVREALPEVEGQGYFEILDGVRHTGTPFVGEGLPARLQRAPGAPLEERLVDLTYQPLWGPDRAVEGILVQGVDVTDRVLAHREVAAAHRDQDLVMAHSRDVLCLADAEGRFTRVSAASEAVFGYRPEELVGRLYMDLVHPDDRAAATAVGAEIRAGTRVYSDLRHIRKDGSVVPVRWSSVWSEADQTRLGVARDRTEAAGYEDALRESEERLRLALDSGGMAVWDWDLATDAVTADAHLRALWGGGPGELRAADLLAQIHADDRPEVERVLAAAIEDRAPYSVEFRVVRPDGSVRWLAGPGRVTVWPDGTPKGVTGVNFDVTNRKRSEEALRASAARATFRAALADAVRSVTDPADIQSEVARALGVHLGAMHVHYAEVEPDGVHAVVVDDYTDGAASVRGRHTLDDFGPTLIERCRAGQRLVVADVACEPSLTDAERDAYAALSIGALVGVPLVKRGRLAVLLGVHQAEPRAWTAEEVALIEETAERTWVALERARAEAEVRELNVALESRVEERTAEVRQLAARLTVAEQEERTRIAHVLHDDLQQQLYGATMALTLLRRAPLDEGAEALAAKAATILDDAVGVARTLATELSPTILQADRLRALVESVAAEKRSKYGLEVEVEVRGDPVVPALAPRVLLYQSLCEVLFNVVKHAGPVPTRLTAWEESDRVVVVVEDSGPGFDMEAVASGPRGGFGLPSVHERLRLVGGGFEIDSAPGRGTRVTLSVPAGEAAPDSP